MTLSQAATNILDQLADLVEQIDEADLKRPSEILNGATIGQHIRHTIEFFLCLQNGYDTGVVNYDKRRRDSLLETDKGVVLATIQRTRNFVRSADDSRPLRMEVCYNVDKEEYIAVPTNAKRELVYNIEHAVHHMAIIKIGIRHIAPYVNISKHFGIAASTIRYTSAGISTN